MTTRPARRAIACLALAAAATLAGCSGAKHGQYTQEHLSAAQVKMDMLKAGTQWQMANQQFLSGDLSKSLKTAGYEVEADHVKLEGPLKELAMYTVKIQLHPEVETEVKVWVVPAASQ